MNIDRRPQTLTMELEIAGMKTSEPDRPKALFGRVAGITLLIHVAAFVALLLVVTNDGTWILDDDRTYNKCLEGADDPSLSGSISTEHLDEWPVAVQCYQRSADLNFVEITRLKASILQGIGYTWLKVSVIAVPLSWLALLLAAVTTAVGGGRRFWRNRAPHSGGSEGPEGQS